MDSLTGVSLTKADGTLLTAETALQNKVSIFRKNQRGFFEKESSKLEYKT
jgi:hypothetical protein